MAYIRGDYYLWADDSSVHIWARDGYDNWDDSVWNESSRGNGESRPSGVALPFEVADEFVIMRIAQIMDARQLTSVINRTIKKWEGNGGCRALTQLSERLKRFESEPDT